MPHIIDLTKDKIGLKTEIEDKDICKTIPGGVWNRHKLIWEYPRGAMVDIARKFKSLTMDRSLEEEFVAVCKAVEHVSRLKNGDTAPRQHPFLMKHQRVCRDIAKVMPSYAFFLDTGTGKTLTALSIIEEDRSRKWLVICPKSIVKTGWLQDAADFYPELHILPLSKNISRDDYAEIANAWGIRVNRRDRLNDIRDKLMPFAHAYIVNPESFAPLIPELKEHGVTGLIFDESAKLKNPSSKITKTTLKFKENLERVYILSGKPAPNTELEYFSQMQLVDPAVFGNSYFSFRQRYFYPSGFMGYDWKMNKNKELDFVERLATRSIFVSKDDCLDLPDKTYLIKDVELPPKVMKYYKEMLRERILELQDSKVIAANQLASIMKMRQITSGFVIGDEATTPLHSAKLDELFETLEEIGRDKQVIIWCNFKHEIRTIEEALQAKGHTVVTAYSETKNVDKSITDFKKRKAQYIIAHPQTLKYGVTFTNCTYAIYYSLSYSFDDYYQSHDRIYRKGQTKPCTFIFLLCPGTIDYDIYNIIHNKKKMTEIIEKYVKEVG